MAEEKETKEKKVTTKTTKKAEPKTKTAAKTTKSSKATTKTAKKEEKETKKVAPKKVAANKTSSKVEKEENKEQEHTNHSLAIDLIIVLLGLIIVTLIIGFFLKLDPIPAKQVEKPIVTTEIKTKH